MTLKLLAPLALLLGIVGGGTSNMKLSCCAPGADCCNPAQDCCFTGAADVKATDCCDAPQESRKLVQTSVKVTDWCGCECCAPGAECCGACCLK